MPHTPTPPTPEHDALWRNPEHWDRWGQYQCRADSRLLVPQRNGPGFTVNMAHRKAQALMWGCLAVVIVFLVLGALYAT